MEAITTAVISAIASIVVALINQRSGKTSHQNSRTGTVHVEARNSTVAWWISVAAIAGWVVVAPKIIHNPDLLVINFFMAVPIATLVFSFFTTPPPLLAASGVLAVHAINAGVMSVSTIAGFSLGSVSDVFLLLGAFTLNAVLAALVARWRRSHSLPASIPEPPTNIVADDSATDANFTDQIARLAKLHTEGKLSDEEFSNAKRKLLDKGTS